MGEHVAQCLVVQVARSVDGGKLEHLVDLRAQFAGGQAQAPQEEQKHPRGLQPEGKLQAMDSNGLQFCFCAWGRQGQGTLQSEGLGHSGPTHSLWGAGSPPLPPVEPWSPEAHAWVSQRALGEEWGDRGANLFRSHLVGLGHQQPLDAEDKQGGPGLGCWTGLHTGPAGWRLLAACDPGQFTLRILHGVGMPGGWAHSVSGTRSLSCPLPCGRRLRGTRAKCLACARPQSWAQVAR